MGRTRGRRQKLQYEVLSVRQKCFESRLRHLVRHQFGVCEAEAVTVAWACLDFLRQARPGDREPFDVCLNVPEGRAVRRKVAPLRAPCRQVVLSPVSEEDTEIWLEQGTRAVQTARAVRLLEQADRAGCTMPLGLLASLVHQTTRTLASRLSPLWRQGLYLPVLGVAESSRPSLSRVALVLQGELQCQGGDLVRRRLLLSRAAHGRLLRTAAMLLQGYTAGLDAGELAVALGLSPVEVESTLEVMRVEEPTSRGRERLRALLEGETAPPMAGGAAGGTNPAVLRSKLEAHLIRRHAFSAGRAELLASAVEEAAREREALSRGPGDIVFWAIGQQEPAGKCLADCELVAATLPFYVPGEDDVPRGTMGNLKVRKAERLATAAYQQGGLLCLPDLAFLLGMGVNSLQQALARSKLILPTRGNIVDIGRGVTHRIQIVSLYVQGYTEPEIASRTHHSYESVAAYLGDFRRVMLLVDQGLPPTHIRKILRRSLALVDKYIALYRQLDVPTHQWKLNLMRQAALEEEKKQRSTR